MGFDYGYTNARVRAMKSHLFDRPFYEKLLDMDDVSSVISALESTVYKKDIDEAMLKYRDVRGMDEAFRRNVASTFAKIIGLVEGEARELVVILLSRWDVHNIKTILRGKNIGASEEDILESLIPGGQFQEALLRELVKAIDIKACLNLLRVWDSPFARPLTANFSKFVKSNRLIDLEVALDRFYFEYALSKLQKNDLHTSLVREITRREIDFTNIMTLFRAIKEDLNREVIEDLFVKDGKQIDGKVFTALAQQKTVEDVVYKLEGTPYKAVLDEGLKKYLEIGAVSILERNLEQMMVRKGVSLFKADPLSMATIIGYLTAKYNEVVNLRIIVRGKSVGMPENRLREALVLV
jgi:V/A-type H+-transporting ATPase subunit C